MTRIVVTGMGTLNPLGNNTVDTWAAILAGRSGIGPLTQYDSSLTRTKFAGEIKGFDPKAYFEHKEARRMDRFSQIGLAAALEAWEQSGNVVTRENCYDIAILISTSFGGGNTISENFEILIKQGAEKIRPTAFPMVLNNSAAAQTAMHLGIKGVNFSVSSACATSSHSIGEGAEIIRRGDASVAIVGGSEAGLQAFVLGGLNAMHALSTRNDSPQTASRPFDATRDGFVISEAAAVLILESLEHAQARGALILAELIGYGATCDASHISAPDSTGEAAAEAMRRALRKAKLAPNQIDYINAHGTGTRLNDAVETRAIKGAFGPDAYRIPVSSTKSMTGHPLSAAGALEAILSIKTLHDRILPPTINYQHPDPDCDLDYVPNQARPHPVETVLSNSFAFGGQNSTLIFRRWSG